MVRRQTRKLNRSFYARPTLTVCHDLIGKYIVYQSADGVLSARIVEVEAYVGQDDPACHAARGMTERNRVMFGPPGFSYIYFIYGMYNCLNFVTEPESHPAAALLRAAEPCEGIDLMRYRSPNKRETDLLSGPGKFCRSFGLTREQNGLDMTGDMLYLEDRFDRTVTVSTAPRIGIREGTRRAWRFFDSESAAVSKAASTRAAGTQKRIEPVRRKG